MKPACAQVIAELPIETADGIFLARYSEVGLASLDFPDRSRAQAPAVASPSETIQRWHRETAAALKAIL
ncbi:MAG TPA: hypothetical protein VK327_10085, partial [Candidatus Paceibacterota bacterium]|nr:hypothetical protein [Candidatus Paceibacterota bacterium]